MKTRLILLIIFCIAAFAGQLKAEIILPAIFGDNMVLQQKTMLRSGARLHRETMLK
jgi:hypothetical protein